MRNHSIVDGGVKGLFVIVAYGEPDYGWLDGTLEVCEQKITRFSQCRDPIPHFVGLQ